MVVWVVWVFVELVENGLVVEVCIPFSWTLLETLVGYTVEVWVGLLAVVEFGDLLTFDVILENEFAVISEDDFDVNSGNGMTVVVCHHLNLIYWSIWLFLHSFLHFLLLCLNISFWQVGS